MEGTSRTQEFNQEVQRITRLAEDVIAQEVLKHEGSRVRWLLHGRVVQYLFQRHFLIAMNAANQALDEASRAPAAQSKGGTE